MENRSINNWIAENKSKVEYSKSKIDNMKRGQTSLGDIIERNFVTAAMAVSNKQFLSIIRTNKDIDYIFGADLKVQYRTADIEGYSSFIDITTNPYKKHYTPWKENVYVMSNGCQVSIGYKLENSVFHYRKPVLVIVLHNEWQEITFQESDVAAIMFICAQATRYISDILEFNYNGKLTVGGGKRASTKVTKKVLAEQSEARQLVIS